MVGHAQPARPAPPVPGHSHGHNQSRGRERERTERTDREQRDRERDRGPQTIGDYGIVRTLGTGSFGKVKRRFPHVSVETWLTMCMGHSRKAQAYGPPCSHEIHF